MRWEKVFVSYDSKDINLVTRITDSLSRVGMEPFLGSYNIDVGMDLSQKIKRAIGDSNCFVPILTKNSVGNQWVNQEIGYAVARQDSLTIFPVVEKGLEINGFIHKSRDNIELDPNDVDSTTYILISVLRAYINRNFNTIGEIRVSCPKCEKRYKVYLPKQSDIQEAVSQQRILPTKCPTCGVQNNLSPSTFEVKDSIRTIRQDTDA